MRAPTVEHYWIIEVMILVSRSHDNLHAWLGSVFSSPRRPALRVVLPSTPSVKWPRYTKRERKDRCWLGGQLLFIWGDFSCCIKPQMWEEWREDCRVSLWGMTQGAPKLLAYPDISPLDGEYTYSLLLERSPWYLARINWRIVLSCKSILHCHGASDKVLCSRNPK